MSRHALAINEKTIDFIENTNGGVRPDLEKKTVFIYSDDPRDNHTNEILTVDEFRSKYQFEDEYSTDNIVIKR